MVLEDTSEALEKGRLEIRTGWHKEGPVPFFQFAFELEVAVGELDSGHKGGKTRKSEVVCDIEVDVEEKGEPRASVWAELPQCPRDGEMVEGTKADDKGLAGFEQSDDTFLDEKAVSVTVEHEGSEGQP